MVQDEPERGEVSDLLASRFVGLVVVSTLVLVHVACSGDSTAPESKGLSEATSNGAQSAGSSTSAGMGGASSATASSAIASGTSAGGDASGGSGGSASQDPCQGVPTQGECLSSTKVAYCSIPTGQGTPTLVTVDCPSYETCAASGSGFDCVLDPGACLPGSEECGADGFKNVCTADGVWGQHPCTSCTASPLGTVCGGKPTTVVSSKLLYELQGPNADFTDWDSTVGQAPAQNILVMSYRALPDDTYEPVDVTVTASDGSYTIAVSSPVAAGDLVLFYAADVIPGTNTIDFAIGVPDVPDGTWDLAKPIPTANSTIQSWSAAPSQILPSTPLVITEDLFSGALRVYDYLRYVHQATNALLGTPGRPLVVWMRQNTSWSCGSCEEQSPIAFGGNSYGSQIFIPALAEDTGYWSDAVTVHELGHWVMASYGYSPNEGGKHCFATPTFPGQAWLEGWATGFSSYGRDSSIYYAKQMGTFFWLDLAPPQYGPPIPSFPFPSPTDGLGLLQFMDENFVAHMLWGLGEHPTDASLSLPDNEFLFSALGSPRMNIAPFGRGYFRHTWSAPDCDQEDVTATKTSTPMVADFFDALLCDGLPAAQIDAVTEPYYPYPSQEPICFQEP